MPPKAKRWKKKEIKDALRRCAAETGNSEQLRAEVFSAWSADHDGPDLPTVRRVMGGWSPACRSVGLRVRGNPCSKSIEEARAAFTKAVELVGEPVLSSADFSRVLRGRPEYISMRVVAYYWGNWTEACEDNGVTPRMSAFVPKDDHWLKEAKKLKLVPNTVEGFNASRPSGFPAARTLSEKWNGWDKFQLAAGCTVEEIEAVRGRRLSS